MNAFQSFVQQSAHNFGIDFSVNNGSVEETSIPIYKSSVWPLHDRMLKMLDVVPIDGDVKAFAQVYAVQVWVYVAGWIISSSIGSLPFQLCKGKRDNPEIIDEGDAYKLLEFPNEWESGEELREDLALYLELCGNGYWEKWGTVASLPVKLYNLEPYFMRIKEHPTLKIDYYQYDTGMPDGIKKFNTKLIAHFKYANPNNIFYGQGSVMPLQSTIITELYRESYNKTFFENEARPDVILKHSPDITKGILPLQKETRRAVAQNWYNTFGGPRKSRLPVLLESGMDLEILSEARRDMDFREMEKSLRERIFACFGIPPAIAGIYETANYATVKEQVRMFWRVTLPPKCGRIANTITRSILKPYDEDLWCRFDLSDISALEETVKEREERLSRMLERGGLSLGQYRQEMGLRVEPNDPYKDKRVISANLIPLDDFFAGGGNETEPKEPGTGGPPQTAGPGFPGEEVKGPERGTHKNYDIINKGGSGSGNFGHAGRPGEVGGSSSKEGSGLVSSEKIDSFSSIAFTDKIIDREMEVAEYTDTLIVKMVERLGNDEITLMSESVAKYSSGNYKEMRNAFITGNMKLDSGEDLNYMEKRALILNDVCSSNIIENNVVYRGLGWSTASAMNNFVDSVQIMGGIQLDAMTSFSTRKGIAAAFIENKKYSVTISLNNVGKSIKGLGLSNISYAPYEKETLLAAGQKFGLKSISERQGGYNIVLEAK